MSAAIDEISPSYLGDDRIALTLATTGALAAFAPISFAVDYSACLPEGIMLPLELIVQGPGAGSYQRRVFSRRAPNSLTFKPREGGSHLVILREVAHNRYWGRAKIKITGEELLVSRPL